MPRLVYLQRLLLLRYTSMDLLRRCSIAGDMQSAHTVVAVAVGYSKDLERSVVTVPVVVLPKLWLPQDRNR